MQHVGTRQAGATFADLICADEQWLREEFDALIAANYRPPGPPPPAPPRTPSLPLHPSGAPAAPTGTGPRPRQVISARSSPRRQRSPPSSRPAPAGTAR